MEKVRTHEAFTLCDRNLNQLGEVTKLRARDGVLFGDFAPLPGYMPIKGLLTSLAQAVEYQLFSLASRLKCQIEELGLGLMSAKESIMICIKDIQITNHRIKFNLA